MIARVGHGLLHRLLGLLNMLLSVFARLRDNTIRLMAELCGQFAVPLQHLFRRMEFLAIPRAVGGNLCRARAIPANLL